MKNLLLLGVVWLVACASASADVITNGLSIDAARKAIEAAGYKQTYLDMAPNNPNNSLQFWGVGQGVLIIVYSKTSKAITGMGFLLTDERPKAFRKTFDLEVTSFDSHAGLMTIKANKGEQDSAANGSQPVRSGTNSTSSAAGSRR
jgi:hypothetical protein